jgi:hypothetical protein
MKIPETYVLGKFYAHSGEPELKRYDNVYNASCPVCREGKSWGKKKRLYYYPTTNSFFCFNCSRSWSAFNWIQEVCNLTKEEIFSEILDNRSSFDITNQITRKETSNKKKFPDLPFDSINLFDPLQIDFYQQNDIFKKAVNYIEHRRLNLAVNKPHSLYLSLTDYHHKNRICIPFLNTKKQIVFYQSRCLDNSNPKYLGKINSDKTLFGIERVKQNIDTIFIFEGPIDAMFTINGVAAAGLNLTKNQINQLLEFPFHKKIWVLDNPKYDETARQKTKELVSKGSVVFRWPNELKYKDFNEWAVNENLNSIDYNLIKNNIY